MNLIQIPRGTRDFSPEQIRKRKYILDLLREVFESYAYDPLETPAMEMKQTLLGKYGEEGDKLIFKIVDNGDIGSKIPANTDLTQITNFITEKALRYDLTIPMARFVAMHAQTLSMPFKRYQMQAVWRGDKPQKGRYREFYQCDVDIVGSDCLLCEAELLEIYDQAFYKLGVPDLEIQINSRKILQAIIQQIDATEYANQIIATIDKIEKIGKQAVLDLCSNYLSSPEQLTNLCAFLQIEGDNHQIIEQLHALFNSNDLGQEGISELNQILNLLSQMQINCMPRITTHLARGIDYYTGMIVEVKTKAVSMGSLGGGGRYQNIANSFGVAGINGVGVSFGVDRIYDVLEELKLFPALETKPKLLFAYMDINTVAINLKLINKLRQASFICMLFPEAKKITKQIKYAEKKNIPYIVFIGEQELTENKATIKNIQTGRQNSISLDASITEWQDCLNKL